MEGLGVERNEAKIRSEVHRPGARWREKCHVSSGRTWNCRSRELSLTGKWGESWLGNVKMGRRGGDKVGVQLGQIW